jgi:hypothetical protein
MVGFTALLLRAMSNQLFKPEVVAAPIIIAHSEPRGRIGAVHQDRGEAWAGGERQWIIDQRNALG